jgi:hypothetical protein
VKANRGKSPVGASESATVLLLAAREDPEFGDRLQAILRLPSFHRKSMINTALNEMQLKGEPPLLMQAIALLADDESAAKIRAFLKEGNGGRTRPAG